MLCHTHGGIGVLGRPSVKSKRYFNLGVHYSMFITLLK